MSVEVTTENASLLISYKAIYCPGVFLQMLVEIDFFFLIFGEEGTDKAAIQITHYY